MRTIIPAKLERGRIRSGSQGSDSSIGLNGAFFIQGSRGADLKIIASDGEMAQGWEHVSVSCQNRCPNWPEMCLVKDLFWEDNETVVQFHPKKSAYINYHPYVLHMWRRSNSEYELPPGMLIAPPAAEEMA